MITQWKTRHSNFIFERETYWWRWERDGCLPFAPKRLKSGCVKIRLKGQWRTFFLKVTSIMPCQQLTSFLRKKFAPRTCPRTQDGWAEKNNPVEHTAYLVLQVTQLSTSQTEIADVDSGQTELLHGPLNPVFYMRFIPLTRIWWGGKLRRCHTIQFCAILWTFSREIVWLFGTS